MNAAAGARQRLLAGIGKAEAAGAGPAGEFEFEAGRAVLEIVQRLRVGLCGIGMVDPLQDLPGGRGGAAGTRR